MNRLVLTQITIKKERSISSTTWYYLLQPSNASAPDPERDNYGSPPPIITEPGYSGWSTTEPTYTIGDDRILYEMVQTIFSDGTFSYTTPSISSSYEAAKAAYSEALLAEADIEELQDLGLHHGYIWTNQTAKSASGGIPAYPIGSYIASGINNTINQANSNTYGLNTWISTGGINLRYNAIDLAKLTTSTLEFYYPSTSSQGTAAISLGTHSGINSLIFYEFGSTNKKMELTGSNLNFYGSSQSTPDASLSSNGLSIANGSITLGSNFSVTNTGDLTAKSGTIGGITIGGTYLTTNSLRTTYDATTAGLTITTSGIGAGNGTANTFKVDASTGALTAKSGTIGGWSFTDAALYYSNATPGYSTTNLVISKNSAVNANAIAGSGTNKHWFLAAGRNFGVDTDGILYANGAHINGALEATSLTIEPNAEIDSRIDNSEIEVGGRNILKNSGSDIIKLWGTAASNGGTMTKTTGQTVSEWGASDAIRVTGQAGSTNTLFGLINTIYANTDLSISGKSYVFSIYIKNNTSTNLTIGFNGLGSSVVVPANTTTRVVSTNAKGTGSSNVQFTVSAAAKSGSYDFTYWHPQIEYGTKVTDWSPAPEDVQSEINAKKSIHTLTTNNTAGRTYAAILELAAEGAQNTFEVNESTTGIKVGDTVRIKYLANDMGTDGTWVYIIGTVRSASSNSVAITAHGLDTTVIDGGHILTGTIDAARIAANSITANKLRIADYNNYVTVTENDESSLLPNGGITITDGWCYKTSATGSNVGVCATKANWTKAGEQYRVTGIAKAPAAGRVRIYFNGRNANESWAMGVFCETALAADTETAISGIITVSSALEACAKCNISVYFYSGSSGSTYQVGYFKQLRVERMSGAELIVDGSITTDKLAANAVTIGKIASNTQSQILNSEIEIGGSNLILDTELMTSFARGSRTTLADGVLTINGSNADWNANANSKKYDASLYDGTTTYTLSFEYNSTVDIPVHIIISGSSDSVNSSTWTRTKYGYWTYPIPTLPNSGGVWKKYTLDPKTISISDLTDGSGDVVSGYIQFYVRTNNVTLKIRHIKLEAGNKATAWTPAPEDTLNSAINVDARNYWRALDKSKRSIGQSSVNWTYDGEGTYTLTCTAVTSASYAYAQIYTSQWIDATDLAGKTVIFHADSITTTNSSADERVYVAMQNASGVGLGLNFLNASNLSRVITLPASLAKIQLIIRMDQNKAHAVGDVMTVVKPKLEIGHQATGWTQAPEDIELDIADSAKTATTYITAIDNDGIKVHAANNPTSNYAKIDASGMEVYNGGTSVARFGESVRLGTNDRLELSENKIMMVSGRSTPFVVENPENGTATTRTMNVTTDSYGSYYDLPASITEVKILAGTVGNPSGTMVTMTIPVVTDSSGSKSTTVTNNGVKFTLTNYNMFPGWGTGSYLLTITNTTSSTRYAKVTYTYIENGVRVVVNDAKLNVASSKTTIFDLITGKTKSYSLITYGHVAVLNMQVQTTATTAAGANVYEGILYSMKPVGGCRLSGYYGGTPVLGGITDTGDIVIRNCGSSSLSVTGNNFISVGGTFIFDDTSW